MEIIKTAIRVRRRTRDPEVIELCDHIINGVPLEFIIDPDRVIIGDPIDRPKFDKTGYMRDYMRKKRASSKLK